MNRARRRFALSRIASIIERISAAIDIVDGDDCLAAVEAALIEAKSQLIEAMDILNDA